MWCRCELASALGLSHASETVNGWNSDALCLGVLTCAPHLAAVSFPSRRTQSQHAADTSPWVCCEHPRHLNAEAFTSSMPQLLTYPASVFPDYWVRKPDVIPARFSDSHLTRIHQHTLQIFLSNPPLSHLSNCLASSVPPQIATIYPILSPRRHPRFLSSHIPSASALPDRRTSSPVDALPYVFFRTAKESSSSSWCQNKCHLFKEAVPWLLIKMERTYTYTCLYHHRILPITQLLDI